MNLGYYRSFFTRPSGSKPVLEEQPKLNLSTSSKSKKTAPKKTISKVSPKPAAKEHNEDKESTATEEVDQDEVMKDANSGDNVPKSSPESEAKDIPTKKRPRTKTEEDSYKKLADLEIEDVGMDDDIPAPKKRGRLVKKSTIKEETPEPQFESKGTVTNEFVEDDQARSDSGSDIAPKSKKPWLKGKASEGKTTKTQLKKKLEADQKAKSKGAKAKVSTVSTKVITEDKEVSDAESEGGLSSGSEKSVISEAARKKVQAQLVGSKKHPYPDWKEGTSVPYAAICKSFGLIESDSSRLAKISHTSLLLQQVLRLSPKDLLMVVHLMINKLAAEFEGIELGIGESILVKAIAESCGRSVEKIKADHNQIGDLGVVAQQSRGGQGTLGFMKQKPLTVADVHKQFLAIATASGSGMVKIKVDMIKRLLASAAKEGDEAKYIVRALEGKMRLGLADKTLEAALSQAVVAWEQEKLGNKATLKQMQEGEEILRSVYRYSFSFRINNARADWMFQ